MECWDPVKIPIITSLSKNFVLFDEWHASIPGPTFGNRQYWHAATSDGYCTNDVPDDGFQTKTLYELLDESDYNWAMYFDQVQDASFFNYTRAPRFSNRLRRLKQLEQDFMQQNLPTVSFILPNFFGELGNPSTDQHPAHAVSLGESLMKQVYEQLRASPSWENSALIVTYDEHGGFYDHCPTPTENVPNPDGKYCKHPVHFDFRRLGIRVPTILISPWVDHDVVHSPKGFMPHPSSKFEHSSFIATLTRQLGLKGPLTERDAWAAPFDYLFSRATPRLDCPMTLPSVNWPEFERYQRLKADKPEHLQPLHDLHYAYLRAANSMLGLPRDANLHTLKTEQAGADYAAHLMRQWRAMASAHPQV